MQQRQPRLGDIVDDYCPRERRLTNHAVVAMVGPDIKQTRCTTCDTEHEYKRAKVPAARKKKDSPPALFKQVLAAAQPEALRGASAGTEEEGRSEEQPAQPEQAAPVQESEPERQEAPLAAAPPEPEPQETVSEEMGQGDDEGPVHRRLIRATLPRPEGGQVQPRPIPQFTVRQPNKFGNNNARGTRPAGQAGGPRPRAAAGRSNFGRNATRDNFSSRPSGGGGQHHGLQRGRPAHRGGGRPMRQGKKSK
ncbi:MAG: hypothetical protein ACM3NQ_06305 [Bacteroidales bacterium]